MDWKLSADSPRSPYVVSNAAPSSLRKMSRSAADLSRLRLSALSRQPARWCSAGRRGGVHRGVVREHALDKFFHRWTFRALGEPGVADIGVGRREEDCRDVAVGRQ
jgi:hypothetical protein